jgi:hypothetical protein
VRAPARWKTIVDELTGVALVAVGTLLLLSGNALGLVVVAAGRRMLFFPGTMRIRG